MARIVKNDFPQRERRANIIDHGFKGRAHIVHLHNGKIDDVNRYINSLPGNHVVWVVAYGNVYIVSKSPNKKATKTKIGTEHRTILLYTRADRVSQPQFQNKLRTGAMDFFNPATEEHEIEYFSIRDKEIDDGR